SSGEEVFQRLYTVDFEPATELTITSIPREAKISYEFGRSAGVPTKISLRAQGGILDDIIQSFLVDPLPSYMNFDLSILGTREFLYESDQTYDVTYALDSEQNGNLVVFKVDSLPERIAATWGLKLGTLGDFAASSFAEIDMSQDVRQVSLSFFGNDRPFIALENFPRKLRFENAVDLLNGTGNLTLLRGLDEVRTINVSIAYEDMVVTKSFDLKNNFVSMKWKIDLVNGIGFFDIARDSESVMMFSTVIQLNDWTFTKSLELRNNHLELRWNVNREQRTGEIILTRDAVGGSPTLSFSLAHDGWILADTLELNNEHLRLFWQLPTASNIHAELGCVIEGGEMFHNTISVVDNSVELFHISVGLQTDDHFIISWDYANGQITNFDWSGRLLQLTDVDIAANLIGDVFTLSADISVGDAGSVELQFNKAVAVNFVDTTTESFQMQGMVSLNANSRLQLSWELGSSGHFTVYTFGQPLGDDFALEFGYDPQHQGNYQYGFRLSGDDFIEITRTIQWYEEDGQLVRVWVLGDEPIPGDWTLEVLWNSQWYTVPWP
ncbi:MAG: hypothetical protein JXA75_07035, partial [Candidatus Thermoplasmatota archaeon]|nr:hypothetical protein [Candidatus Thermoplasmatota archaeon]